MSAAISQYGAYTPGRRVRRLLDAIRVLGGLAWDAATRRQTVHVMQLDEQGMPERSWS